MDADLVVHRNGEHSRLGVAGNGRSFLIGDWQKLQARYEHGVCMRNVEHALQRIKIYK